MEKSDAWWEIGGKGPGDLVLAVDFTATGRPDARFADIVGLTATSHPVWETMPQAIATDIGPSGEEYLDRWFEDVRASGRPVGAVLGFCAGAVYAAALAGRIAQWQERAPQLVLFDPEPANAFGLLWQFHNSVELFAGIIGAEPVAEAQETARRTLEADPENLGHIGPVLVGLFRQISEAAFDEIELEPESRTEFTESFTSFVAYVVAAGQLNSSAATAWTDAVAFSSGSPLSGLNRLRSTDPDGAAGAVARELRFDCDHTDLLRDEGAATALAELLTAQDLSRQIRM
ncbi:hypothetical protein [Streptomyces sp. H39-S7]|uniref:hypothetical protein n=1 Tax=Streptomyces sp. H39-S7 TaxID=3004357 RepID=UPI0022B02B9B|nr:hypothetical protein [Streptomyces sp. H39-S7]MCZ4123209.1 hypothetical protein [Streptomyces sp. H39-S7]